MGDEGWSRGGQRIGVGFWSGRMDDGVTRGEKRGLVDGCVPVWMCGLCGYDEGEAGRRGREMRCGESGDRSRTLRAAAVERKVRGGWQDKTEVQKPGGQVGVCLVLLGVAQRMVGGERCKSVYDGKRDTRRVAFAQRYNGAVDTGVTDQFTTWRGGVARWPLAALTRYRSVHLAILVDREDDRRQGRARAQSHDPEDQKNSPMTRERQ